MKFIKEVKQPKRTLGNPDKTLKVLFDSINYESQFNFSRNGRVMVSGGDSECDILSESDIRCPTRKKVLDLKNVSITVNMNVQARLSN